MSILDIFTGQNTAADQKRGEDADAALRALNKKELDAGKWTQDQWDQSEANISKGEIHDAQREVEQAFGQGIDEGAANIRGAIGSTINTAIGTPLKLIPWQVWLGLGIYLAYTMGLFRKLTR